MHTCPECGEECHCGNDMDYVYLGEREGCSHCKPDGESEEDDDDDPEFDNANRLVPQLGQRDEDLRYNYERPCPPS